MDCDILLVEDDEGIREPLKDLLGAEGYSVTTARHGREALETLDRMPKRPKLILLDLMMPHMSGAEFLAAIRKRTELQSVAIVIMTAWMHRFGDVLASADEVVNKPLDTDYLLAVVRRYCGDGGDAEGQRKTDPAPRPTPPRSKRGPSGRLVVRARVRTGTSRVFAPTRLVHRIPTW